MKEENKNGKELQSNNSQQNKTTSNGISKANAENQDKEKMKPVNKDQTVNRAKPEIESSKTAGAPETEAERPADNKEEQNTDVKAEEQDIASDKAEDAEEKNETDKM
ncbi:MAG: hypothetical protein ACXVPQ_10250 [Bacteroidia bacterium]